MASNARILEVIFRAKDETSKVFNDVTKASATMGDKLGSVGRTATLGLSVPLAGIGGMAVKLAMGFDQSMKVLQTTSGAASADMQKLEAYANKMGSETKFSGQQAADAMVALSKAGMTTEQIMGGGLSAAMSLAATEGMDLSAAADVTTNTLNMFGLSVTDGARAVDAIAGASAASTASVGSLSEALAQVGPGAKTAGLSLNDTVGVLAAFDQAGLKGSDAGTSLKTMLTRLVPQTDKQQIAMERLGLSFVDGKGNIDNITTVAQKLQDKLGGLSQEQRTTALATIFGSDATRAASILMDNGAGGIQKYITASMQQGKAAEMAGAYTKSAAGKAEAAASSVENAGQKIGKALLPILVQVAEKVGKLANDFTKWWDAIGPGGQKAVLVLTGIVIAAGPIASVISLITGVVGFLSSAFVIQGVSAAAAWLATLGPVALVIAAIALVAAGVYLVIQNWDKIGPFFKKMWDGVVKFFTGFWDTVKGFVGKWGVEILAVMMPFVGVPLLIKKHWNVIGPFFKKMWDGVVGFFKGFWTKVKAFIAKWGVEILAVLVPFIGVPLLIKKHWDKIGPMIAKVWDKVKSSVKQGIDNTITYVKQLPQRMVDALKNLSSMIAGPIKAALKVLADLNPFTRHSPSLVDNVMSGTAAIARAYAGVSGMKIAAPQIGGISLPSMAGISSFGTGSASGGGGLLGTQKVQVFLDGRELTRSTARVSTTNGRNGSR